LQKQKLILLAGRTQRFKTIIIKRNNLDILFSNGFITTQISNSQIKIEPSCAFLTQNLYSALFRGSILYLSLEGHKVGIKAA